MTRLIAAFVLAALTSLPAAAAERTVKPLLTPAEFAGVEDAVVIDIRDPKAFGKEHLPGAVNLPYGKWRGTKTNPGALLSDARVTELLQSAGITPESTVVVVNEGDSPLTFGASARVYWTLKSAGLEDIAILNGGVTAWTKDGRALSRDVMAPEASTDDYALSTEWSVDRDDVQAVIDGESEAVLIDARPDIFFKGGKKHPAARLPGTLRSAVNLVHESFFGQNGVMTEDPDYVMALARDAGWSPGQTVVSFCNTGHWAASNWFALSEIAGLPDVKLYPESMVGWHAAGS
ncbi:MAG: rhodanese-like domain-containing protein [Pseudomonadota bacterium]